MKHRIIGAGFDLFRASRLDRLVGPLTQGLGAILMFHHVRPEDGGESRFRPNRLLEITPEFLDAVLQTLRRRGFDILSLDDAVERIAATRQRQRPFAVLTFDDGYRDNRDHALPILERHGAPFTVFVTSGFAERTARLWWKELEFCVARARAIDVGIGKERLRLAAATDAEKNRAFATLYKHLRSGPEERLLDVIAGLCWSHGVDGASIVVDLCMDFDEIAGLAEHPLCTIGAHTTTHAMLAKHDAAFAYRELAQSREIIAARLGRAVSHVAYPVGDPGSAGPREFDMAREIGFTSGVTTRPGMIFPAHAAHATALPRLSINGCFQQIGYVEALLSGAPFALWNRGRRLNVA